MENETIALPLGKQVLLRGHFDAPVTLEHARALSNGYECRVRLSDGSLQEAVISREEALVLAASLEPGKATNRPVDAEKLRLLIESARVRLAYTHDRQFAVSFLCPRIQQRFLFPNFLLIRERPNATKLSDIPSSGIFRVFVANRLRACVSLGRTRNIKARQKSSTCASAALLSAPVEHAA